MIEETIIKQIKRHVTEFKMWLKANYTKEAIAQEWYDDIGYPKWNEIEDTFELAFKELQFENLIKEELDNISFLFVRQWKVRIIFHYFKAEISLLGMTEEQLLILCTHGLEDLSVYSCKVYSLQSSQHIEK